MMVSDNHATGHHCLTELGNFCKALQVLGHACSLGNDQLQGMAKSVQQLWVNK